MSNHPRPETTRVILLGASAFPKCELYATTAFLTAADAWIRYFRSRDGFGLPNEMYLKSYFDSEFTSADLLEDLSGWVRNEVEATRNTASEVLDVFVCYIGHGLFGEMNEYCLALRQTRTASIGSSSLRLADLAVNISSIAPVRVYLILDACFSGYEAMDFMSNGGQLRSGPRGAQFPSTGVSMICSSSHDLISYLCLERNTTVFTDAMLDALRNGNALRPGIALSLREAAELSNALIERRGSERRKVLSVVHSPQSAAGDIASIPLFPNSVPFANAPSPLLIPGAVNWESGGMEDRGVSVNTQRLVTDDASKTSHLPARHTAADDYTHVIVLIHGIRDIGAWQETVSSELAADATHVAVVRYAYHPALRFLFPLDLSRRPVQEVVKKLQNLRSEFRNAKISIIAHSFGTFVVQKALRSDHNIKLWKLVFCGSVADDLTDWSEFKHRIGDGKRPTKDFIINDCGTGDYWPVLGAAFGLRYGMAGALGFSEDLVTNRFFRGKDGKSAGGHSLYFDNDFVSTNWRPFLIDDVKPARGKGKQGEHLKWWATIFYSPYARLTARTFALLIWLSLIVLPVLLVWLAFISFSGGNVPVPKAVEHAPVPAQIDAQLLTSDLHVVTGHGRVREPLLDKNVE